MNRPRARPVSRRFGSCRAAGDNDGHVVFLVALLLFAAAAYWLYTSSSNALETCRQTLGFRKCADRQVTEGTSQDGFHYHQSHLFDGTIEGLPAELHTRTISVAKGTVQRRRGSQFTVLTIRPERALPVAFHLHPAGMMSAIESLGASSHVTTGDPPFDAAYHLYSANAAATVRAVSPAVRKALLEIRAAEAKGADADSAVGRMALAFRMGSIEVDERAVSFLLFGSPSAAVAERLQKVAPFLVWFARELGRQ